LKYGSSDDWLICLKGIRLREFGQKEEGRIRKAVIAVHG